jgi:hypothetical protein
VDIEFEILPSFLLEKLIVVQIQWCLSTTTAPHRHIAIAPPLVHRSVMSAFDPGAAQWPEESEEEHTNASLVFDVLEAQFVSIERLVGKLRQSLATDDAPASSPEVDSPLQLMQVEELTARIIKVSVV